MKDNYMTYFLGVDTEDEDKLERRISTGHTPFQHSAHVKVNILNGEVMPIS